MKRIISLFFALLMLAVPSAALAAEAPSAGQGSVRDQLIRFYRESMAAQGYTEVQVDPQEVLDKAKIDPQRMALANMDLSTATAAQREEIFGARRQIAYSVDGWCADGLCGIHSDPQAKTYTIFPQFSDLFPGWDQPTSMSAAEEAAAYTRAQLAAQLESDLNQRGYTKAAPMTKTKALAKVRVTPRVRELAYSDLAQAAEGREKYILAARAEIAYSAAGWYDDKSGIYAVSVDEETKTYSELPKFSELFPGWDVPVEGGTAASASEVDISRAATEYTTLFDQTVSVPKYVKDTQSDFFLTKTASFNKVVQFKITPKQMTNCTKINLGLSDISTSPYKSLFWRKGVAANQSVEYAVDPTINRSIGFRTSVYDQSNATARILIESRYPPITPANPNQ